MVERFYVKVQGTIGCRASHKTLESAYREAKRLWDINGGERRVDVLQVLGSLEPANDPSRPPVGEDADSGAATVEIRRGRRVTAPS